MNSATQLGMKEGNLVSVGCMFNEFCFRMVQITVDVRTQYPDSFRFNSFSITLFYISVHLIFLPSPITIIASPVPQNNCYIYVNTHSLFICSTLKTIYSRCGGDPCVCEKWEICVCNQICWYCLNEMVSLC